MDNASLTTITQFNLTRPQINSLARHILDEIDSGMYNPLEVHLCLRAMEELVKRIKEGIADQVMVEANKYGRDFTFHGSQFQITARRTFDYSADAIWTEMDRSKKQREEMLKHLQSPVADPNTGEMIYPARYKATQVLSVTLAG
ncbi:MAG: hypothetical protein PHD61_11365 [Bacteroidales bacterium]|nr:hypothetical protein [Lentimicrobiaceae bacterium]MDD5695887.1 hypothetical protein [Bacteroidales bacterium]